MKKLALTVITLLFVTIVCTAQTTITLDYQTGQASSTALDLTGKSIIQIINVPSNLPTPIGLRDNANNNITIDLASLTGTYKKAVFPNGDRDTIKINIVGGKLQSPFLSSLAIQVPITILINGKTVAFNRLQPPLPAVKSSYIPGYIYYDAVKLYKLKSSNEIDSIKNILSAYGGIGGNAFLKQVFGDPIYTQGGGITASLSGVFSSLGNINVTNAADALAKIVVKQFKTEAYEVFIANFNKFLASHPEFVVIFPATTKYLKTFPSNEFANVLSGLKTGFQQDLNAISGNLIKLRDLSTYSCHNDSSCKVRILSEVNFLNRNEIGNSIIASLILTNNLVKGNNIADALNNLAIDKVCSVKDTSNKFYNIANSIQLVNLISQSLLSKDTGKIWISKQEIGDLLNVNNITTLEIYLGLLYGQDHQNPNQISFSINGQSKTFETFLNSLSPHFANIDSLYIKFKNSFQSIANSINDIDNNAQNIIAGQKQGKTSSLLVYSNYLSSISNMLIVTTKSISDNFAVNNDLTTISTDVAKFSATLNDVISCSSDIQYGNYNALVLNSADLIGHIFHANSSLKTKYIQYGTLMANIIDAKSSDDIYSALDAVILPPGSYAIKRQSPFNVSINAYIGPNVGGEYLPALKTNKWGTVAGLTAPIGVAFSWGNKGIPENNKPDANGKITGGKSISLFVSLIDIGALTSYRLQNDSSSISSQIKLANIVAPGLFVYYGFGKTPISLGIGGQLGPQLRSISSADTANIQQNYYFKFGISLVVDLPLFNLYTRPKD